MTGTLHEDLRTLKLLLKSDRNDGYFTRRPTHIKVLLKSDRNDGYFTRRPTHIKVFVKI